MMRERPIIFAAPMVRALLAGRKTQTRRVVRSSVAEAIAFHDCDEARDAVVSFSHEGHSGPGWYVHCSEYPEDGSSFLGACPYGVHGDRLWVRETWCHRYSDGRLVEGAALYAADGGEVFKDDGDGGIAFRKDGFAASPWRSPLYMPRWASRIALEVAGVRIERLSQITNDDAEAEGVDERNGDEPGDYRRAFRELWECLHGVDTWATDPWVWVLTFKRIEQPARTEAA